MQAQFHISKLCLLFLYPPSIAWPAGALRKTGQVQKAGRTEHIGFVVRIYNLISNK